MALQSKLNVVNAPFILAGDSEMIEGTIIKDTGRTAILKQYTVLAKIQASQKYTPYIATTNTDGSSIPCAIYLGQDIAAASLVAGDQVSLPILIGGPCKIDTNQLVFDGNTLNGLSVVQAASTGSIEVMNAIDKLSERGIYITATGSISGFEN